MKPSYYLPGLFWDGRTSCGDYRFDDHAKIRSDEGNLFVSRIISCGSEGDIANAARLVGGYRRIHLLNDCESFCHGAVPQSFCNLRVRQIAAYIAGMYPGAEVVVSKAILLKASELPRVTSLFDCLLLSDALYRKLLNLGCGFDRSGFPIIPKDCYAREPLEFMVDWDNRHSKFVSPPSESAICFFRDDARIYRRLATLERDISEYRRFGAVVEPDLTVTSDMDLAWQNMTMLINRLAIAFLAFNGIKIVANSRCGGTASRANLGLNPKGVVWASSTLGCADLPTRENFDYLVKMLALQPAHVMVYGKVDRLMHDQLSRMGIPWRAYPDFHALSKNRSRGALPAAA